MLDLVALINNPKEMDRDTLYELRSLLALYPYFQTARLLMLQNLYLLHDPTFDEELRRAAIYITDRQVLFQLIEAAHYQHRRPATPSASADAQEQQSDPSRTLSLIDTFLSTVPRQGEGQQPRSRRKPTPADAAVDYVAYLLESETADDHAPSDAPQLIGQELIDSFINSDKGRIVLSDSPQYTPEQQSTEENGNQGAEEGYFTETLARIYIKQGRYSKALEIIQRLSLQYPKKNAYFADQIRFLEKLIINNSKKQ